MKPTLQLVRVRGSGNAAAAFAALLGRGPRMTDKAKGWCVISVPWAESEPVDQYLRRAVPGASIRSLGGVGE